MTENQEDFIPEYADKIAKKPQSPKVFIERAEPLTREGIRAICMSDEDYEKYRKDKTRDTQSQDNIFIRHIQSHLKEGEEVICKICEKTAKEIIENTQSQETSPKGRTNSILQDREPDALMGKKCEVTACNNKQKYIIGDKIFKRFGVCKECLIRLVQFNKDNNIKTSLLEILS